MAKSPHISRAKMESILAGGGSVQHRGRIIVDPAQLPSAAELAEGDDEARAQVLLNLDKQQQEIDRQRRMLQFDELRNEQKPGPLDAQLAGDPAEARRHPPRQDPDARLRTAYDIARETGYERSFHDFKADYEKRAASVKAEAEKAAAEEAKKAEKAEKSESVPTKEGEPQDAEHPHVEGKAGHQVVKEEHRKGGK